MTSKRDTISSLCEKYTELKNEDIRIIQSMSEMLQHIADLEDTDIFIDCPIKDGEAIVVAEAKPSDTVSSYQNSVVGMLAKQNDEPAVARTFRLGVATKHMKALTQEGRYVIQSVQPIINEGRVIGVLIREQRTEHRDPFSDINQCNFNDYINPMIREPNADSWLMEYIDEGLIIVNSEGVVGFRNNVARKLYESLGYVDDILGQKYQNISLVEKTNAKGEANVSVVETKVGKHYLSVKHVFLDEERLEFAVIIYDLTWKRKQEQELILKSVAIKEMHHRVKNNLQTIASLLRLQIRRSNNEETKKNLGDSMSRVLSIASTHDLLAKNVVDRVKIGDVISNIKENAMQYIDPALDLKVTIEGDDFFVTSDIATTVALVINELIQNSLRHAFVDRDHGNIRICIHYGVLYSSIQVIDDGCGFDTSSTGTGSFGLHIVESLVRDKLQGILSIQSEEKGTCVSFEYSNKIVELGDTT